MHISKNLGNAWIGHHWIGRKSTSWIANMLRSRIANLIDVGNIELQLGRQSNCGIDILWNVVPWIANLYKCHKKLSSKLIYSQTIELTNCWMLYPELRIWQILSNRIAKWWNVKTLDCNVAGRNNVQFWFSLFLCSYHRIANLCIFFKQNSDWFTDCKLNGTWGDSHKLECGSVNARVRTFEFVEWHHTKLWSGRMTK